MKKSLRTLLSCTVRGYTGRAGNFVVVVVSYIASTVLQFLRQTTIYPLTDRQNRLIYHKCECPRYSIEQAVWVSEFRSLIGRCVSRGAETMWRCGHYHPSCLWFTSQKKMCSCTTVSFPLHSVLRVRKVCNCPWNCPHVKCGALWLENALFLLGSIMPASALCPLKQKGHFCGNNTVELKGQGLFVHFGNWEIYSQVCFTV